MVISLSPSSTATAALLSSGRLAVRPTRAFLSSAFMPPSSLTSRPLKSSSVPM